MAEERGQVRAGVEGLRPDPIVEALVPDPGRPRRLAVLAGFVGASPTPGVWRLYLTPRFDQFVEVPEGDILAHRQSADDAPSLLWVGADIRLEHHVPNPWEAQAGFLVGSIVASELAGARPSPGPLQTRTLIGLGSFLHPWF
jgi:hypothetical protein